MVLGRVAIYVRVSTGQQVVEGNSLEGQEQECYKIAEKLGIPRDQIDLFREEGFSGDDIDRPVMNELFQRIKDGEISTVIATHPDRIGRNVSDKAIFRKELERYNVKSVFVYGHEYAQTDEGRLLEHIMDAIAEYELKQIKRRTTMGRLVAVKNGKVMPTKYTSYGYHFEDGKLVINEKEAVFVRKIFQWYVREQLTMREIGERLVFEGAKPRKSQNWNASTILRIINSETYIGRYYYRRRKTNKIKGEKTKSNKPRLKHEFRPEEEW